MKKRLKELFEYENGLLIRIVKTSNNTKVGDVVGTSTDTAGYAIINNCLDLLKEIINEEVENQDKNYQEHIQRESR